MLLSTSVFGQYDLDELKFAREIEQIAMEGVDSGAYPGCQILIAKDNKIIFQKAFGYHTYDQQKEVDLNDIYDLASITKATAATLALMKLYDDQLISLDDPLAQYWIRFKKSNKSDLKLREVLAHNARLKSWIPYYKESRKRSGKYKRNTFRSDSSVKYPNRVASELFMHKDYREKKMHKMIRRSPLNKEPGYVYSGLSFYLYPEIVENLTGDKFEDYLYNNFYKPVGARTLRFNPSRYFDLSRIVPTEQDDFFRNELIHGTVHDEGAAVMLGVSGNAGLFGSAADLAKVWQMLLNNGIYGDQRYLSKATIEEFTRCQYCDEGNRRGLGFDKPLIEYDSIKSSVAPQASPLSFGHTGYTGTLVWADPKYNLLYIFLSNRVHPTRDNRKLYTMNIRPRIHELIYRSLDIE